MDIFRKWAFNFNISNSPGAAGNLFTATKHFTINNQGRIGIGTGNNSLTEKLEVAGTVKATRFMLSDGTVLGTEGSSQATSVTVLVLL